MSQRSRMYEPCPLDTSGVELPASCHELLEKLAAHNHDIWAARRIAEGWTYGPQRDDQTKQHPCLVPYPDLPESEKEYDRQTSLETLKAILSLGYRIEASTTPAAQALDEAAASLVHELARPDIDLAGLLALWRTRGDRRVAWNHSPDPYRLLARRLLSGGAPLIATEVVTEGLQFWEHDLFLRQLLGLALARTGSPERACAVLEQVRDQLKAGKEADPYLLEEMLGTLARTHKDLALLGAHKNERQAHLRQARELYGSAYEQTQRYWTGVNVATLATLAGDDETARRVSEQVRRTCLVELDRIPEDHVNRYWILATLGETALNQRDWSEAERFYREAARAGADRFGDLASTRRQAKLLVRHLGREESLVDGWLPVPRVAVFTGHMIDRTDRPEPRFPARFVRPAQESIRQWLDEQAVRIGFSSAACGADLLFQEALHEVGAEAHIVLPYEEQQFVADSVAIVDSGDWAERFREMLEQAAQVVYASGEKMQAGSVSYDYANLILHGLAAVRARELEAGLLGLSVWDGRPGDGPGGTASVVARWHGLGVPVYRIDLSSLPEPVPTRMPIIREPAAAARKPDTGPVDSETQVMAMLFADAVNFSRLTESEVPRFVQHFLGTVADVVRRYGEANVVRNTWGDGLYLVFTTVRAAGLCALDLRDAVAVTDWAEKGLPKSLNLRIALHAGPVFGGVDPVTGHKNYTGTHVSRAARLEPKTPPGEVYASEAFAALVAVEQVEEFACEYVRQLEWAKHYGTFPTYLLRRA